MRNVHVWTASSRIWIQAIVIHSTIVSMALPMRSIAHKVCISTNTLAHVYGLRTQHEPIAVQQQVSGPMFCSSSMLPTDKLTCHYLFSNLIAWKMKQRTMILSNAHWKRPNVSTRKDKPLFIPNIHMNLTARASMYAWMVVRNVCWAAKPAKYTTLKTKSATIQKMSKDGKQFYTFYMYIHTKKMNLIWTNYSIFFRTYSQDWYAESDAPTKKSRRKWTSVEAVCHFKTWYKFT